MNTFKLETGCYIDGHWGIYAPTRLIEIAQEFGCEIGDNEEVAIEAYKNVEDTFIADTGEEFDAYEWVVETADYVMDWMNEFVAEEDHMFGWEDGEFFYQHLDWWDEDYSCPDCKEEVTDEAFICKDCTVNTLEINEYYMVHDIVWLIANNAKNMIDDEADGMLCIECLEDRLERRLEPDDFTTCPLNTEDYNKSDRLRDRLGL